MKLAHFVFAGACFASVVHARSADACTTWETGAPLQTPSGVRHEIPVYLYAPDAASNETFVGQPTDWLEQEVRMAVDLWLENSHADLRPYYAGRTSDRSAHGRIVIKQGTSVWCGDDAIGCTVPERSWSLFDGVKLSGATVHLNAGHSAPLREWVSIIAHEIGHGFGLADLYDTFNGRNCVWSYGPANIMGTYNANWFSGGSLGLDDQETMIKLYGPARRPASYMESGDGISWQDGSPPDSLKDLTLESRVSSSANRGTRARYVESNGWSGLSAVSGCNLSSCAGETRQGLPEEGLWSFHPAAVADASSSEWLVAFTIGEAKSNPWRNVAVARTTDGGASYQTAALRFGDSTLATRMGGVSATYDPRSKTYLVVYRDIVLSDHLRSQTWLAVVDPGSNEISSRTPMPGESFSVPAVECGEEGSASNCLLVWPSEQPMHLLAWTRFRVDGASVILDELDPNLTLLHNYSMPALTAFDGQKLSFVVALKREDGVYTHGLAGGGWSAPSLAVAHLHDEPVMSPTLAQVRGRDMTDTIGFSKLGPSADDTARELHLRYGATSR